MSKPGMVITGAAGYVGRQMVAAFQPTHELYCIDRLAPEATAAPEGHSIHWFRADIRQRQALADVFTEIRTQSAVEIVLHLAGYYDFTGDDHPEYHSSNVEGMRNVLEQAELLPLKKLIFTSSVAACPFPLPGQAVNEQTPPTGTEPYSRSKRAGEELLQAYGDRVPAVIVRLAAVITDWCEYDPLTNFIETWLHGSWNARVLGGHGGWGIPYIHMLDLAAFFQRVVAMADVLTPLEILQGSPAGAVTERQLFEAATAAYFGHRRWAVGMPKPLARVGIKMREGLGRVTGHMPFERSWMGRYIDQSLTTDASYTHNRLGWSPRPELHILQRVPIMVDNLRQHPQEWRLRQERRKSTRSVGSY